jgi:hypothetical protein
MYIPIISAVAFSLDNCNSFALSVDKESNADKTKAASVSSLTDKSNSYTSSLVTVLGSLALILANNFLVTFILSPSAFLSELISNGKNSYKSGLSFKI